MRRFTGLLLGGLAAFSLTLSAAAQAPAPKPATPASTGDIPAEFNPPTPADYTRKDVMIPMRDGVKLHAIVIAPKTTANPAPILLSRTPYGAGSSVGGASQHGAMVVSPANEPFFQDGYILVYEDIRGRYGSEGGFVLTRPLRGPLNTDAIDESTDTYDTIAWLVKETPNNNGRVGLMGGSYGGFLTLMGLVNPHPALKAAAPMYSMVDGWTGDDFYHNGAFRQGYFDWMYDLITAKSGGDVAWGRYDLWDAFLEAGNAEGVGRMHGVSELPAWRRVIDNAAYTPYWRDQALQRVFEGVPLSVPTLHVAGLFDQEDSFGTFAVYRTMEAKDVGNDKNFLAVGPWFHGQSQRDGSALGQMKWGADTSLYFRRYVLKPFFDQYLKDRPAARPIPPVTAFETGANEWRTADRWPLSGAQAGARKLYLLADGRLGFDPPTAGGEAFAQYVSDPAKPVPYRRRPIRPVYASDSTWSQWLTDDQRDVSTRPDVLTYVSAPLTAPLTISGDVAAKLMASTTGSDADWVVKLIDVFPPEMRAQPELGGYELMISADIMRGRYREDVGAPKAIAPNKVLPYRVRMPAANHTFLPGHRIMVQVQSSWFPLYDRNPQTFVPEVAKAPAAAYKTATQRIYASSYVELPVR
ncbi:MAG: CocE/NonD family hydrolase [Phenylobacterium sp.]